LSCVDGKTIRKISDAFLKTTAQSHKHAKRIIGHDNEPLEGSANLSSSGWPNSVSLPCTSSEVDGYYHDPAGLILGSTVAVPHGGNAELTETTLAVPVSPSRDPTPSIAEGKYLEAVVPVGREHPAHNSDPHGDSGEVLYDTLQQQDNADAASSLSNSAPGLGAIHVSVIRDVPFHDSPGDIDHVGQLFNSKWGADLLLRSTCDLRCPFCSWSLQRRSARPFAKLGAPRKYGDEAERRAGRAKQRKDARQRGIRKKKEAFWAKIRAAVGNDESFMTQATWFKHVRELKERQQYLIDTGAENHQEEEDTRKAYRTESAWISGRIEWCQLRVDELRKILHS